MAYDVSLWTICFRMTWSYARKLQAIIESLRIRFAFLRDSDQTGDNCWVIGIQAMEWNGLNNLQSKQTRPGGQNMRLGPLTQLAYWSCTDRD